MDFVVAIVVIVASVGAIEAVVDFGVEIVKVVVVSVAEIEDREADSVSLLFYGRK